MTTKEPGRIALTYKESAIDVFSTPHNVTDRHRLWMQVWPIGPAPCPLTVSEARALAAELNRAADKIDPRPTERPYSRPRLGFGGYGR